jgi:hypothetical protein
MQYHIPNAINNPNSPFNILGILFFGKFLGREDVPYLTSDDDGTYIQSSASRSCFVWDRGKHERHFMHMINASLFFISIQGSTTTKPSVLA